MNHPTRTWAHYCEDCGELCFHYADGYVEHDCYAAEEDCGELCFHYADGYVEPDCYAEAEEA